MSDVVVSSAEFIYQTSSRLGPFPQFITRTLEHFIKSYEGSPSDLRFCFAADCFTLGKVYSWRHEVTGVQLVHFYDYDSILNVLMLGAASTSVDNETSTMREGRIRISFQLLRRNDA